MKRCCQFFCNSTKHFLCWLHVAKFSEDGLEKNEKYPIYQLPLKQRHHLFTFFQMWQLEPKITTHHLYHTDYRMLKTVLLNFVLHYFYDLSPYWQWLLNQWATRISTVIVRLLIAQIWIPILPLFLWYRSVVSQT